MSLYAKVITDQLAKLNRSDIDPRHVEGYMRCEHGTLDALSRAKFNREVQIAVALIEQDGLDTAEALALSYGLRKQG